MHSPVRSEAEVFWGVVAIGVAALVVGLIGGFTDGPWWAIAAAVLLAAGLAFVWARARGAQPLDLELPARDGEAHRILVLANETVEGEELLEEIRTRAASHERVELLVVCPALAGSRLQHLASDTDGPRREAHERLRGSLAALRGAGMGATGIVGDDDPAVSATDALRRFRADEVIISTHPPHRSRWLERGVVEQVRREVPLPVTHVVVDHVPSPAGAVG